jgi:hypothetical protein
MQPCSAWSEASMNFQLRATSPVLTPFKLFSLPSAILPNELSERRRRACEQQRTLFAFSLLPFPKTMARLRS